MGLLYPFPISSDETDHVSINSEHKTLTVKSYGLPYIFWIYLLAFLTVVGFLFVAIKTPLMSLWKIEDSINQALVMAVFLTLFGTIFGFITLFFIELRIIKKNKSLNLETRLFGIKLRNKKFSLKDENAFQITNFRASPNMARIENRDELKTHQNKGYFELFGIDHNDKRFLIDRHSRKSDLVKLKELLQLY